MADAFTCSASRCRTACHAQRAWSLASTKVANLSAQAKACALHRTSDSGHRNFGRKNMDIGLRTSNLDVEKWTPHVGPRTSHVTAPPMLDSAHGDAVDGDHRAPAASARPLRAVLHRAVGALQLLLHDGDPHVVHGRS